ncbi:MAG: c-type cytochrome [Candidatus Eutrophobiaceae bacterium]
MSLEQDRTFFRNFSIMVAVLFLCMVSFLVLGLMVGTDTSAEAKRREAEVAKRTAPIGNVAIEGEESLVDQAVAGANEGANEVAAAPLSGEAIYNQMCVACHSIAGIGAPVTGNIDDWAPRLAKGKDVLYENAINGYTGPEGYMMPARGGGSFSDEEVKAAVDYMVQNSQ